jgi:hypothetical protein
MSDLYDRDVVGWAEQQADLLQRVAAGEPVNETPDWNNIAEEIDAFGKSLGRELASRIAVILIHLIKLETSPASGPRPGWRDTIRQQRDEIERLLEDAPSLRARIPGMIERALRRARARAEASLADHAETPRRDPALTAYTVEQVIGGWLPDLTV